MDEEIENSERSPDNIPNERKSVDADRPVHSSPVFNRTICIIFCILGIAIMLGSGLCSVGFVLMQPMIIIFAVFIGGIPFAIGFFLFAVTKKSARLATLFKDFFQGSWKERSGIFIGVLIGLSIVLDVAKKFHFLTMLRTWYSHDP